MNNKLKKQAIFALEDDNEVMTSALDPDSYLDEDNKQMNRELIEKHNVIIGKLENDEELTSEDLQLIRDANEMDVNDEENIREHHFEGIELQEWLDKEM